MLHHDTAAGQLPWLTQHQQQNTHSQPLTSPTYTLPEWGVNDAFPQQQMQQQIQQQQQQPSQSQYPTLTNPPGYQGLSLEYIQQNHLSRPRVPPPPPQQQQQTYQPQQVRPDMESAISALQAQHIQDLTYGAPLDTHAYGLYSQIQPTYPTHDQYRNPSSPTSFGIPAQPTQSNPHRQQSSHSGFASLRHIPSDFLPQSHSQSSLQSYGSSTSLASSSHLETTYPSASHPPTLSLSLPPVSQPPMSQPPMSYAPTTYVDMLARGRHRSDTVSSASSSSALDSPMLEYDGSEGGLSDYSLQELSPLGSQPQQPNASAPFDLNLDLALGGPPFHRTHSLPQLNAQPPPPPHLLHRHHHHASGTIFNTTSSPLASLPTPPVSKGHSPTSYGPNISLAPLSIDLSTPKFESDMQFPDLPSLPPMLPPAGHAEVDERMRGLQLGESDDIQQVIQPYIEQYVRTPNRVALGERSILIMTSRVAQKSYGTEKRFLCPPPTAILLGNSWFHPPERSISASPPPLSPGGTSVPPGGWSGPRVTISIEPASSSCECPLDWTLPSGLSFEETSPPGPGAGAHIGRCIGKQLYISDKVDDRKKKVDAVVCITEGGVGKDGEERILGNFVSRPIKVISKPSKKRQSSKNMELCINHGSTISLFHRLRSQTVSTKYLCVSGSGASLKGSDGKPLPGADIGKQNRPQPQFVARTASWDAFVIYIVDVNQPASGNGATTTPALPEYPSPPPNAVHTPINCQTPIYYNQTVVLQCLISGVVSPVLIIRRVDHQSLVVGGGVQYNPKTHQGQASPNAAGNKTGAGTAHDAYCAPGEVCGDPVSQLHKIALEVYDPHKRAPPPHSTGTSGAFLSCAGEKVNTFKPAEPARVWNERKLGAASASHGDSHEESSYSSSTGPSSSSAGPPSPVAGVAFIRPGTPDPSNDGGRVKRKRGSISAGLSGKAAASLKGRKRNNSAASGSSSAGSAPPPVTRRASEPNDADSLNGATWSVDVTETCVWTVVGTDQVRYNFYVPPVLFSVPPTSRIPRFPSKPITPMPGLVKYLPPDRAAEAPNRAVHCPHSASANPNGVSSVGTTRPPDPRMITVYGQHFDKTEPLLVYFGTEPSALVDMRCTEVIQCMPPAEDERAEAGSRRPMLLVRRDGVIFPSNVLYP